MNIKIPKEIQEYKESLFWGLNTRQFFCSLLAVGAAVGVYFGLRDVAGTEVVSWACILAALPFALCGFVRYHGLTAERLLWTIIKSELLTPRRLLLKPKNLYYSLFEARIQKGCKKPSRERKEDAID